jgi:hypothetical protein
MPSTQLVIIIFLTWQHVSTSKYHLQANSIKYIKGNMCIFIEFGIEILILQDDKVHVALSDQLCKIKINIVKRLLFLFSKDGCICCCLVGSGACTFRAVKQATQLQAPERTKHRHVKPSFKKGTKNSDKKPRI